MLTKKINKEILSSELQGRSPTKETDPSKAKRCEEGDTQALSYRHMSDSDRDKTSENKI